MSKAKFATAKGLIAEKRYTEARAILKTINHPTARQWEAKLDQIEPAPRPVAVQSLGTPAKAKPGCARQIANVVVVLIAAAVLIQLFQQINQFDTQVSDGQDAASQALASNGAGLGTRSNPYPLGTTGSIRDGRFRVNSLLRGQSTAVNRMNMFNTAPDPGQEWVLANVSFSCDLPSNQTCNTTAMQIEIVGDLGSIYITEWLAVLDNKFTGEVFGGGSKTGIVGFIINSQDTNMLVAINDLGSRFFFQAE